LLSPSLSLRHGFYAYASIATQVREFMASKGLSSSDLRREAAANDWTEAEWLAGKKSNFEV